MILLQHWVDEWKRVRNILQQTLSWERWEEDRVLNLGGEVARLEQVEAVRLEICVNVPAWVWTMLRWPASQFCLPFSARASSRHNDLIFLLLSPAWAGCCWLQPSFLYSSFESWTINIKTFLFGGSVFALLVSNTHYHIPDWKYGALTIPRNV